MNVFHGNTVVFRSYSDLGNLKTTCQLKIQTNFSCKQLLFFISAEEIEQFTSCMTDESTL